MNYDVEAWYKLYIRESTEDKMLPVLNRSLRDFLLRFAKSRTDPTILAKTASPGEDLARALGAHEEERDQIVAFVGTMIVDGYLSHRKGRLWITNFVEAQLARTPAARRQKKYRDTKNKSRNARVTPPASSDDSHATVASRVASQKRRSEESRDDPNRDEPSDARAAVGDSEQTPKARAAAYLRDKLAVGLNLGQPDTWPEVVDAFQGFQAAWGPSGELRGPRDPRVERILERFAEGFTVADLRAAADGSKLDDHIATKPELQTVLTVWRDAAQVDKFRRLLTAPPAARKARATDHGVDLAARREARLAAQGRTE